MGGLPAKKKERGTEYRRGRGYLSCSYIINGGFRMNFQIQRSGIQDSSREWTKSSRKWRSGVDNYLIHGSHEKQKTLWRARSKGSTQFHIILITYFYAREKNNFKITVLQLFTYAWDEFTKYIRFAISSEPFTDQSEFTNRQYVTCGPCNAKVCSRYWYELE